MIPKSADAYSRLSKELQIAALICGALAGAIVYCAKVYGHVDLIDPNLHEYEMQLEQERRANEAIYSQAYSCPEENEVQKEQRDFDKRWNEEFEREQREKQDRWDSGRWEQDYDRGIERDTNSQ